MDVSVLDTMAYLTHVASASLSESFDSAVATVERARSAVLRDARRLRGVLYSVNAELEQAMRTGEVPRVRSLIAGLTLESFLGGSLVIHCFKGATLGQVEEDCFVTALRREFVSAYGEALRIEAPEHFERSERFLKLAIAGLRDIDPELAAEVQSYVVEVMVCASDQVHAGSSFRTFGTIYLRELQPDQHWIVYLEHLVHEAAHLHLYALWKNDQIVMNESKGRFSSPLRREPRPLSGIFHAMFVLARLLRASSRLKRHPGYAGLETLWVTSNNNASNAASLVEKFEDAWATLHREAELTCLGEELLVSAREMAYE
jgi:hypothetical protein